MPTGDAGHQIITEHSAAILAAVDRIRELDSYVWLDNARHFSCCEAESIAGLIRAWGDSELADQFLGCHAESDDHGDIHIPVYDHPDYPDCVTGFTRREHEETE